MFVGTDEERAQTIAAFRGAAAAYRKLAAETEWRRRGASVHALILAAEQAEETAAFLENALTGG